MSEMLLAFKANIGIVGLQITYLDIYLILFYYEWKTNSWQTIYETTSNIIIWWAFNHFVLDLFISLVVLPS